MASVVRRPGNKFWVQFKGPDGKRRTIRLGKVTEEQANGFKWRLEKLVSAKMLGHSPDYSTIEWIQGLAADMATKLAEYGLTTQANHTHTLKELLDDHLDSANIGPRTKATLSYVHANLLKFFTPAKDIATITPADADKFRGWLAQHGSHKPGCTLAVTTCSRRAKRAKQIFEYATTKKKWLKENPFGHLSGWKDSNRDRDYFVSLELLESILDACHSAEFRAILALARCAALRCPSEVLTFRWDWIDWDKGWLYVRSPKNRRFEGKEIRHVPLFPTVRKYLRELYEFAPDGQPLVFPQHQVTGIALTNELQRICRSIGLALWAKPWQNMRASCETELLESFPVTVVTAWVGHSPRVMLKHYLQVVKEHHTRAITGDVASPFASPVKEPEDAK